MSRNLFPTRPGAGLTGLLLAGVLGVWPARPSLVVAEDSAAVPEARRTETVRLIDRCLPAVVSIFAQVAGADGKVESRVGSGTIIRPTTRITIAASAASATPRGRFLGPRSRA